MPRKASGQLVVRRGKRDTSFGARIPFAGSRHYVTLGYATEGMTEQRAREEIDNILADVRREIWTPPAPSAPVVVAPEREPTFHEYASDWLAQREQEGLKPKTITDLRWSLVNHLLPFFASHGLSAITPREVKRYTQAKLAERNAIEQAAAEAKRKGEPFKTRSLSNSSINHTVKILAQVLEAAVDDELLASNPATGSRRRLKTSKPSRPWVEPEQLMALLDSTSCVGHTLLALLAGAGLRIGEALALRWRDVDLGTGSLYVVDAKTPKGIREVHLTPALREELSLWKVDAKYTGSADYVIHPSTGRKHNPSNLRRDVLFPAVGAANVKLEEMGIATLAPITFHSLRRTYASLRCVCGDDIRYTADQLGHEDPRFTLKVYAQATKRRDRLTGPHLKAYDRALEWAQMGTSTELLIADSAAAATRKEKSPA
jgi:integrase